MFEELKKKYNIQQPPAGGTFDALKQKYQPTQAQIAIQQGKASGITAPAPSYNKDVSILPAALSSFQKSAQNVLPREQNIQQGGTRKTNFVEGVLLTAGGAVKDIGTQLGERFSDVISPVVSKQTQAKAGEKIGDVLRPSIEALSNTPIGKSFSQAAKNTPLETKQNLGAAFDVASVIPTAGIAGKGLKTGIDLSATGIKKIPDLAPDLTAVGNRSKDIIHDTIDTNIYKNPGNKTVRQNYTNFSKEADVKTILKDRDIRPEIDANGTVNTKRGQETIKREIDYLTENADNQIKRYGQELVSKKDVTSILDDIYKASNLKLNPKFQMIDEAVSKYLLDAFKGKTDITVEELQGIKRYFNKLSADSFRPGVMRNETDVDINDIIREASMKAVNSAVTDPKLRQINEQLRQLITTDKFLKKLDETKAAGGRLGRGARALSGMIVAGGAGLSTGNPFLAAGAAAGGGVVGDQLAKLGFKRQTGSFLRKQLSKLSDAKISNPEDLSIEDYFKKIEGGQKAELSPEATNRVLKMMQDDRGGEIDYNAFAGGLAGVEQGENGEVSYNPLLGAVGGLGSLGLQKALKPSKLNTINKRMDSTDEDLLHSFRDEFSGRKLTDATSAKTEQLLKTMGIDSLGKPPAEIKKLVDQILKAKYNN